MSDRLVDIGVGIAVGVVILVTLAMMKEEGVTLQQQTTDSIHYSSKPLWAPEPSYAFDVQDTTGDKNEMLEM